MADHGFSERRACRLVGVNRSAWQYEPLRGKDDAVRERMREIANERRRFGYRRLAILLKREGKGMNLKKVYRLYREERLTVRKRGDRKRALGTRAPMAIPQEPNQRWSLDFVSDALACGRRFRMLNVIDDYSRECLACIVDTSLSGRRVVRELTAIAERRGLPCMVVSDNGIQFTTPGAGGSAVPEIREAMVKGEIFRAHAFEYACAKAGIDHRTTKPKHPWTNGQVERMNRTIKDATVKRYHYDDHEQLRQHLDDFVAAYNFGRRLKTLKGLTPYEFICKRWTIEPEKFTVNPIHQTPGLNI